MDTAVALVQTYLRVNGYFTVTEFPVVEAHAGSLRSATDIDVLACRFPDASQALPAISDGTQVSTQGPDSALDVPAGVVDMIVAEVKEARAEFNPAGLREEIVGATLARFGCCGANDAALVAGKLLTEGRAVTHAGHQVRLIAFGSRTSGYPVYRQIGLDVVVRYLERFVADHFAGLRTSHSKDESLALFMLLEKIRKTGSSQGD